MMARKRVTIEEKIERQKEVVSRIKDKYDAALDELERLMQKREELQKKELLDAFVKSERTYEEIMEFLKGGELE
jgi:formiminotetrahydrofolate cyclodeaminase